MASLNLSASRKGQAAYPLQGKTVDVVLASSTGTAADTIDLNLLGMNRVKEVWVKVPASTLSLTNIQLPTLAAALVAGTYRFVGA